MKMLTLTAAVHLKVKPQFNINLRKKKLSVSWFVNYCRNWDYKGAVKILVLVELVFV